MPKDVKIDGKNYNYYGHYNNKRDAQSAAGALRASKRRWLARVVPTKTSIGTTQYYVYTRMRKGY